MIRPLIGTLIGCVLMTLLTVRVHGAFLLALLIPFFILWLPYCGYVVWKHPARRKLVAAKIGLWTLVVAGVCTVHVQYQNDAREAADRVAASILAHQLERGTYPQKLEEAAPAAVDSAREWRVMYRLDDGKPTLFYPRTYMAFEIYWFDFDRRTWGYEPRPRAEEHPREGELRR